jgi:4-hydroxybenzoate polyprenyltransferase
MRGTRLLRFALWWQHIVPPVLAAAYLAAATGALAAGDLVAALPPFLASIVGIAGFGYFFNDVCDIAADRAAGKANAAAALAPPARAGILCALLVLGIAPWSLLPRNPLNLGLLALQIALLTIYSSRPIRLKERGFAGALADAAYGHLVPVAIAVATFFPALGATRASAAQAPLALLWTIGAILLAAKGLRNILLHQLADRENDRRAGIRTVVLAIGPVGALSLVNRVLLPLETSALVGVLVLLAPAAPVWIGFAAFLGFTVLMFSAWKFPFIPKRQLRTKFLYFLNDFYEEWLPPTVLAIAVARQIELWPLLPLHFALFPRGLAKLPRNLSVLRDNFAHAADF